MSTIEIPTESGRVSYRTEKLSLTDLYLEPESKEEVAYLVEISSNWMKLYSVVNDLTSDQMRRLMTVEVRGRKRQHILERVVATTLTKLRQEALDAAKQAGV